jgi:hypothetical protein
MLLEQELGVEWVCLDHTTYEENCTACAIERNLRQALTKQYLGQLDGRLN